MKDYNQIEIDGHLNIHYCLDNSLHRLSGPAVKHYNGDKVWYLYGYVHRAGGPAIEYINGHKCWYLNSVVHRDDGPAYELTNGIRAWYLHGKCLNVASQKEFESYKKTLVLL